MQGYSSVQELGHCRVRIVYLASESLALLLSLHVSIQLKDSGNENDQKVKIRPAIGSQVSLL